MPYIGKSPTGSGVRQRYHFTATGGETSLSGADDNSKTLKFTDGEYVDVYLNGILLVQGTDYGVGTANTISSLAALSGGDIVEVVVYDIFNVAKINSEAVRARHYYTATGGETSIGTSQITGLSFAANADIDVSLNGISLVAGTDYNTTTANTVGGLSALSAGNVIEIVIYEKFQLADTVSKAQGGTFNGGVTFNGGISNLIRIQTFTANGTYTPSTGASRIMVIVTGGGGSGAGYDATSSGSSRVYHGGGGGAGSTAIKIISGVTSSYSGTVTIGSGGNGTNDAGSSGGTSSFADGTNTLSATGGSAGSRVTNTVSGASSGGAGGTATGGDVNIGGGAGGAGVGVVDGIGVASGTGGSSYWGGGGSSGTVGSSGNSDGDAGVAYGSGGGAGAGAHGSSGSVDFDGGSGADGIVVVYEYL